MSFPCSSKARTARSYSHFDDTSACTMIGNGGGLTEKMLLSFLGIITTVLHTMYYLGQYVIATTMNSLGRHAWLIFLINNNYQE